MRKLDEQHHTVSLVLGHIFKDNEGLCVSVQHTCSHYVAIT